MRTTFPFTSSIIILLAILLIVQVGSLLVSSQSGEAIRQHPNNAGASLLPSSYSSPNNKAIGRKSTLPVIQRNGPSYWRSSSEERRAHAQIMRLDNQRVAFLQSNLSNGDHTLSSEIVTLPVKLVDSPIFRNYVVNINLGTPKQPLTMIFDTGSDLTWTRCKPLAVSCYNQDDQTFKPYKSSSYKNKFDEQECKQMASGTSEPPERRGSTCYYGNKYHDGSYTRGFFASETLSLSLSPNDEKKDFRFGCGQDNEGKFFGKVAGVMGFGRHEISVVQQTESKYVRIFSYCLPDIKSPPGYLSLGINRRSHPAFAKMLTLERAPSSYGIKLVAISVNKNPLGIHPSVFSKAGTVIDSGTVITRLPQTAYKALQKAIAEAMSGTPMVKLPEKYHFDTCYRRGSIKKPIPKVTFTFANNVEVILERKHIFFTIRKENCECLAFMGNGNDNDLGIYGNHQQLGFEVIHDLEKQRIAFVEGKC